MPLPLHFLAGLKRRHFNAGRAVVNRLRVQGVLLGDCLIMDGHAEAKCARPDENQKAGPRRYYSIIRGTLLWTHATLTNLPSGTGCLAASSMP